MADPSEKRFNINRVIWATISSALILSLYEVYTVAFGNSFLKSVVGYIQTIGFILTIYFIIFSAHYLFIEVILSFLNKCFPLAYYALVFLTLSIWVLPIDKRGTGFNLSGMNYDFLIWGGILLGLGGIILFWLSEYFQLTNSKTDAVTLTVTISLVLLGIFSVMYRPSNRYTNDVEPGPVPTNEDKPNIIYIGIDTLRADHLNQWGHDIKTPTINQMARNSIQYKQTVTPITVTRPSFTSMFTSRFPFQHKVFTHGNKVPDDEVMLAEVLSQYGYQTAGFAASYAVLKKSNIDQGFQFYQDKISPWYVPTKPAARIIPMMVIDNLGLVRSDNRLKDGYEITRDAEGWLQQRKSNRPLFLFLHYKDPHGPYSPPYPYNQMYDPNYEGNISGYKNDHIAPSLMKQEDIDHVVSLYDGEISYLDKQLNRMIQALKTNGLWSESIVIFVSDHGEALSQHGQWKHGLPYEHNSHVPLFIRFPDEMEDYKSKVTSQVRTIDIAPTILDYLNIDSPKTFYGKSLLKGSKKGESMQDRFSYLEVQNGVKLKASNGETRNVSADFYAFITPEYKYIQTLTPNTKREELYNLKKDPGETTNLIDSFPKKASELKQRLPYDVEKLEYTERSQQEITELEKEALKGLGYLN